MMKMTNKRFILTDFTKVESSDKLEIFKSSKGPENLLTKIDFVPEEIKALSAMNKLFINTCLQSINDDLEDEEE